MLWLIANFGITWGWKAGWQVACGRRNTVDYFVDHGRIFLTRKKFFCNQFYRVTSHLWEKTTRSRRRIHGVSWSCIVINTSSDGDYDVYGSDYHKHHNHHYLYQHHHHYQYQRSIHQQLRDWSLPSNQTQVGDQALFRRRGPGKITSKISMITILIILIIILGSLKIGLVWFPFLSPWSF